MATHRASVSVVVATYGRRASLPRFLDALVTNHGIDEILVVVDGSHDGSFEYAEDYHATDSRVRALLVDHQGQFGALDTGARAATGDILLLLDDDIIVSDTFVAGHVRAHEQGERVVLGYMPPRRPGRTTSRDFATVLYAAEYEGRCRRYEQDASTVLEHLWGGNVSLHRSDYERVDAHQMMPPASLSDVRLYHQDRDFGFQCLDAGLTGHFDRSIAAVHEHQRSVDGFLRDAFGQGACDVLLAQRHPGRIRRDPSQPVVRSPGAVGGHRDRESWATRRTLAAAVASRSLPASLAAARATRRIEHRRGARAMVHHLSLQAVA